MRKLAREDGAARRDDVSPGRCGVEASSLGDALGELVKLLANLPNFISWRTRQFIPQAPALLERARGIYAAAFGDEHRRTAEVHHLASGRPQCIPGPERAAGFRQRDVMPEFCSNSGTVSQDDYIFKVLNNLLKFRKAH